MGPPASLCPVPRGPAEAPWRAACGVLSLGLVARALWNQYGVLRHARLPYHDLGLPLIGHTWTILRESIDTWVAAALSARPVALRNYFFSNAVLVDYPVYLKHLQRAELDGKFTPCWISTMQELAGESSVLVLPGGKGHQRHKRLRGKILHSLAPKPVLAVLPQLLALVRQTLDGLAARTAEDGHASFEGPAAELAARASAILITAGLDRERQERMDVLGSAVLQGAFALPLDLGPFSAFGRAKAARREMARIVESILQNPNLEHQNILVDLMRSSEAGEPFTLDEICDTAVTLLLAGKFTTADALPTLLVKLFENPDWAARVAAEPLEFNAIEEDSAALRVVHEVLRLHPPGGAYRRICHDPSVALDLGEHGRIPPGCPFAVVLFPTLWKLGGEFDPDRWTPERCRSEGPLSFGGSQPHACIGKNLALLELQAFARVLCREYDFECLDTEMLMKPSKPLKKGYKDDLRITVRRRPQA